jgi:indole-3-glycerol phosphate synthase
VSDVLKNICDDKLVHVENCKAEVPFEALVEKAKTMAPTRGFLQALRNKAARGENALIAEIKKASPSKGLIREDFDVAAIAEAYVQAGAACLSVLTDVPYFQGNDQFIAVAKEGNLLPVLRKDFMLDPYQIVESRVLGADCILLIMAALEDTQAHALEAVAMELGMDVLIEVHNAEELARALKLKSTLLGINNRNLKTLEVDLATSEALVKSIPDSYTKVCESGIYTAEDISRMNTAGFTTFLVGESLMRQEDIEAATRALLAV